jgi:hypothetical protein
LPASVLVRRPPITLCITENTKTAERVVTDVLAPMLKRPVEALRALSLPIGPAELCAERLSQFAGGGARRIFLWPLGDELAQLELFRDRVAPSVLVEPTPPAHAVAGS